MPRDIDHAAPERGMRAPPPDDVRSALADKTKWPEDKLTKWARGWHWDDCAEEHKDPSIYGRDIRMLKAFEAALRSAPVSGAVIACLQEIVDLDSQGRYGRLAREAIDLLGAPVAGGTREAQKQQNRNYASSAMLVCISLADEVACKGGTATDVAAALRERLGSPVPDATVSGPIADERVKQLAAQLIGYVKARPDYDYDLLLAHVSETLATFAYNEILNHRKTAPHVGREATVSARDAVIEDRVKKAHDAAIRNCASIANRHRPNFVAAQIKRAIRSLTQGTKP